MKRRRSESPYIHMSPNIGESGRDEILEENIG